MKSTPILMSPPMVVSVQNDSKTETRRALNLEGRWLNCPYGDIGDELWVKETFYAFGFWKKDGLTKTGKQKWKFEDTADVLYSDSKYLYLDNPPAQIAKGRNEGEFGWYKRSSLFMPRKASRLTLKIGSIHIEQLHDITEEGAIREGIEPMKSYWGHPGWKDYVDEMELDNVFISPIDSYKSLWESINGIGSWAENPWVYVIKFAKT
jgi:hypothetical protein